jgi:putative aldouronate transport system substrate-binding protein
MHWRQALFCAVLYGSLLTFSSCAAPAPPARIPVPQGPAPCRFSLLRTDGDSAAWGEDEVSAYLSARFNLQIDVLRVTLDADRALQALCASESLPDALYLRRDASFLWLIEQGRLLPLDDFLTRSAGYAPSITPQALEMSRVRDHVYALLSGSAASPSGGAGWVLRRDLYESLGSPPLETLADVRAYALLARGSVSSPVLLGAPFDFSQVYAAFGGSRTPALYNLHVALDEKTGRFSFIGEDPAFASAVLYCRALFTEGLLPPNWFVMQKDQICAQLERGDFALFAAQDIVGYPLSALGGASAGTYMVIPPPRAPGAVGTVYTGDYNLLGDYGIALTKGAAQPERIFAYFDFIASAEGQRVTQFGPPGALYQAADADGYPVLLPGAADIDSARRAALGLKTWSLPYMADYASGAARAANRQCAPAVWDLAEQWKAQTLRAHSRNVTDLANIEPTCAGAEQNAVLLCEDLYASFLPRMLCAASDEEALELMAELNRRVRAVGFDFALRHYDWFHRQNLDRAGP